MKTLQMTRILALTLAGVCMTMISFAQGDKASRPSPPATASGKIGGATITINYSSPSVKGRNVWDPAGTLAPYGKVWRAGANEATIFETDKDIKVEGKTLPAGKYSLFATPGEKDWKIIFNSQTGQWGIKRGGEANRDPANDVLTVEVKPKKTAMTEKLVYEVNSKGVDLKWDTVDVPISIK
ncbi:DUF2911 domain-containing protein [Spirosoma aerolatum]|uniref:DUF2911 domain-containing protein n=1 Tax=Spirosoma aerolatum TaxID=1211326 RepID=UPI0009AD64E1|nr:DUF2911 domain-containing protein [Spirosoma aerolatum]